MVRDTQRGAPNEMRMKEVNKKFFDEHEPIDPEEAEQAKQFELENKIKESFDEWLSNFYLSAEENLSWNNYDSVYRTFNEISMLRGGDTSAVKEFFSVHGLLTFVPEGDVGIRLGDRARDFERLMMSAAIGEITETIAKDFSGLTLRLFVDKAMSIGVWATEQFFISYKANWRKGRERQWAILEQFLLDEVQIQELAEEQAILEMPEADENGQAVIELNIPSLQLNPGWYEYKKPVYVQDGDDKDYQLPAELAAYHNLESARSEDFMRLLSALRQGDQKKMEAVIEKAAGLGPLPAEKMKFIVETIRQLGEIWEIAPSAPSEKSADYQDRLAEVEKRLPLPASAGPLEIENQLLDKKRTIEPFTSALRKRLLEAALSGAVDLAKQISPVLQDADPHISKFTNRLIEDMIAAETKARALYSDVCKTGVPVFRDFATWLAEESKKPEHQGEFYVGRDTLNTLYPTAHALRWGKMTGAERHKLTVFVNVSRQLNAIDNENDTPEDIARKREVFRKWLEQEQVTKEMMGIDGGYQGSSPKDVLTALNPTLTEKQLDQKIRLIEVHDDLYSHRRFNARTVYSQFVAWMESLPKYANRSKEIAQNEFSRYYVVDPGRRSPIERVLAWTVQHAVWRELINHDPVAHPLSEKSDQMNVLPPDETPLTPAPIKKPPVPWGNLDYLKPKSEMLKSSVAEQRLNDFGLAAGIDSFADLFIIEHSGKAIVFGDLELAGYEIEDLPHDVNIEVQGVIFVGKNQTTLRKNLEARGFKVQLYESEEKPEREKTLAALRDWAHGFGKNDSWVSAHFGIWSNGEIEMLQPLHLEHEQIDQLPQLKYASWSNPKVYVNRAQTKLAADARTKGFSVEIWTGAHDEGEPEDGQDFDGAYPASQNKESW